MFWKKKKMLRTAELDHFSLQIWAIGWPRICFQKNGPLVARWLHGMMLCFCSQFSKFERLFGQKISHYTAKTSISLQKRILCLDRPSFQCPNVLAHTAGQVSRYCCTACTVLRCLDIHMALSLLNIPRAGLCHRWNRRKTQRAQRI